MRVLIACDWHLKYAVNQAVGLERAGAEVRLLCRDHALEFGGSTQEREEYLRRLNGTDVHVLEGRVSSPSSALGAFRLRRRIHAWRPDVVHAHDNADPRLLAIASGLPRVVTLHDPIAHPGQRALPFVDERIHRRWIKGADAVVVHGRRLASDVPDWASTVRVAELPHGAYTVRDDPDSIPTQPTVLLFGRLEPYKGIGVLVRAMEVVWAKRSDVRLLVAGDGPEGALLTPGPRVEVRREYIPEGELDALFARATIAVLPYVSGTQSGAATLSLGRGIPTIVSDTGALGDVAVDDSFLVAPGDPNELAAAILLHLDHDWPERQRVLAFARQELSWDAWAERALTLYAAILREDA